MKRYRLLIVEDEAIVAMDIKDRLAGMGYDLVGHATNGELALSLTRECRPDLVLMDIRLQGDMDGITAAEEIRRRFHVPVIFLTAYSEDETLERAKLAEPYGFILKPFDDRELKFAIEIALYKHRAEEEIRHLNRLYDVLSQVNQTVVRVQSREELFSELCQLLVERGDVDLAWIGWLDPDTSQLVPVAWAGENQDLLTEVTFAADGRPEGQGNPGKALRSGEPSFCNKCAADHCLFPAEHSPEQFGFHSCGSFPLRFQGEVCASLNICVEEPGFFGDRENDLLREVALDVSFALDKIEADAQRLRLNDELQRQTSFLTTLMEALPSPVFYKDSQFRYLGCNAAYEQLLGVSRDQLIGKTAQELWPSDPADNYHHADQELLASKTTQLYEGHLLTADGSRKDVVFHKAAYRNPDGGLEGIIGIVEDITARKSAGLALWESEERFRIMFESSSVGMAQVDPHTGLFLRVNQKMSAITGYTTDELLGISFREITHPADRSHDWQSFQRVMNGEAPAYHNEKRYIKKDGTIVWVNVNSTMHRDSAGQPLYSLAVIEDITARKEAEADLRQSQARLHLALSAANMGFWEWDLATNNLYWSPECFDIFGELPLTGTLDSFVKIVHPEDIDRFMASIRQAVDRREAYAEEFRVCRANGDPVWVANLGQAEYDRHGKPLRMVSIIQDITARRQTEAALQQSERRFRQMAETVDEVFWLSPPDFKSILYISPAFEKVWGYTCAQLYAKPLLWREALHPDDQLLGWRALKDLSLGQPYNIEYRIIRPDGSLRWINDRGYPLLNEAGQVILTSGVASDITERKEAENALRDSEEKFRLAMEAIQEGLWDWHIPTGELFISPNYLRLFGYDPEQVENTYDFWMEAMHPEDFPAYQELVTDHLAGNSPNFEAEFRGRIGDGRYLWFRSRGKVVARAPDGAPLRMVGALRDITEGKKARQDLEESLSLHKATLESTADGILAVNNEGRIVSWNRKFTEMWRIPDEVIESRDHAQVRTFIMDQLQDPEAFLARCLELFRNPVQETQDLTHFNDGRVFERYSIPQYLNGQIVGRVLSFRNITARVQGEAALRQSEAGYRRIVETANEGIWAVDLHQRTTYVNQLMAEMLGYSREEMLGRLVTDFMFPDDLADHQDVINRRQRGKYERRLKRRDGSELWTIVSVRALIGEAGEFLGSFAMLTDITERKRAEEQLKESERRVRSKLESILTPAGDIGQLDLEDIVDVQAIQSLMDDFCQLTHLPMSLIDLQGKVLVNVGWHSICTKFHRAHPEAARRCVESDTVLSQNVPPGSFKLYKCLNNLSVIVTPVLIGGKHVGNLFMGQFLFGDEEPDYEFFAAQAREFGFDEDAYLAALAELPRLDQKTVDAAMGFYTKLAHMISLLSLSNIRLARAVAEQDQLVESLRLSEEKSRAGEEFLNDIFSSIRDGITVLDLDRTVIQINSAAQSFTGKNDIVGRKCHEVFHQRDSVCPNCPVEHTLKTGKVNQAVVEVERAGGKDRFVEIFSHPLINRSTGQVRGVIEYVRDVTERRRAEEALAASHRELQATAQELENSRNMLELILESIPVRVFWKDKNLHYLGCNTLFARDAGFQHPEELLGQDDLAMGWREEAHLYRADDREVIESNRPKINIIEPVIIPSGKIWAKTSKVPLSGSNGKVFGILGVYEDITELKKAEDQLRASLEEKEVMLKEIHHRVKNNMQMISTLFDLQLKFGSDQDPAMIFRDCQNRIRSMALVHESLYHTDTLASINFRQYLEKLLNRLLASFGSRVQGIRAQVSGPAIFLGINQAVPAGLVASELIVNCLKHAFPEQQPGEIHITLAEDDGRRVIEITDNGIGLNPDFSLENPATFGWLMITNLMKQLEGTITVTSANGTFCRMVF